MRSIPPAPPPKPIKVENNTKALAIAVLNKELERLHCDLASCNGDDDETQSQIHYLQKELIRLASQ